MSTPIVSAAAGSVADAVASLQRELDARGIRVFAVIDHAGGARDAGLELPDEVVVVFGSPAVGTALMQSNAVAGLDLPLRMLLWDDGGQTRAAFHDPHELAESYDLSDQEAVFDKLSGLMRGLATALS